MRTLIRTRVMVALLSVMCALTAAGTAHAGISGTNAKHVDVTVKTKQGGTWFTARATTTDQDGVVTLKNALPGKYRFFIDSDDRRDSQTLALQVRLLDERGRRFTDRADVAVSVYTEDGTEVVVGTYRTDRHGWLDLVGITHGTTYKLDVKDTAHLKKKKNKPRVRVKAKIDDSKWFPAVYKRLRTDGTLRVRDVLPGSYKFSYKRGDAQEDQPFTLHMRLRTEDGKTAKRKKVTVYAYPFGIKRKIGTFKTTRTGDLVLPGVRTGMKYKIRVKD